MGVYQTKEEWKKVKENAPVVIQWEPERDRYLMKLNYRTIQIGLSPSAASLYVNEWIVGIHDLTGDVQKIRAAIKDDNIEEANSLIPKERKYEVSAGFQ